MNPLARKMFPEKAELFDRGFCTNCQKPINFATELRDEKSHKEYQLSGWCQSCQDKFFTN